MNREPLFETRSGLMLNYQDPQPEQIDIEDIAWSLAGLPRFLAHTKKRMSIAEHSLLVARLLADDYPEDYELQLAGLLHDAAEAYTGDIPSTLKDLLPKLVEVQAHIDLLVAEKFGLDSQRFYSAEVKKADLLALSWEAKQFKASQGQGWTIELDRYIDWPDQPMSPETARLLYIQELKRLSKKLIKF